MKFETEIQKFSCMKLRSKMSEDEKQTIVIKTNTNKITTANKNKTKQKNTCFDLLIFNYISHSGKVSHVSIFLGRSFVTEKGTISCWIFSESKSNPFLRQWYTHMCLMVLSDINWSTHDVVFWHHVTSPGAKGVNKSVWWIIQWNTLGALLHYLFHESYWLLCPQ